MDRVINLFAGPGAGKSTTASALFSELKYREVRSEYVPEFIKGATWEKRGDKVFKAQEYIFGKQSFNLSRVASEVSITVTDSPLMLGINYISPDNPLKSLPAVIYEAHCSYDSLNIFINRVKAYDQAGRNQDEEEAKKKDLEIIELLKSHSIQYHVVDGDERAPERIIKLAREKWGKDLPNLYRTKDKTLIGSAVEKYRMWRL